jgi:hypothetical protein
MRATGTTTAATISGVLASLRDTVRPATSWMQRNKTATALLIGLVWGVVTAVRMLWPPAVGLADSGDGLRLMCQIGVAPGGQRTASPGAFWEPFWPDHRYFGEACGVPGTGETYTSSELILLRAAEWLGVMFGPPGGFDLRLLALLCAVLVGAGVALWTLALPPSVSMPARLLIACVVGLIMVDSGIARFYASPYSEPAALLGVMLLCPALLWLLRQRRYTWGALVAVAGLGAFAMLAKTQMVSVLPVLCVVLLLRPSMPTRWRGTGSWWRLRLPALGLAGALIVLAAVHLADQPKRYTEVSAYGELFDMILPLSQDPAGDLAWFDLDPSLANGSGTTINSSDSVVYEPSYAGFADRVTPARIGLFYLTHPGRLGKLADTGMRGMASYNTETYLASYTADSGMPAFTTDSRIPVVTWVFSIYRDVPALIMLHWLVMLALFLYVTFGDNRRGGHRPLGLLGLVLMAMLTIQFWTVLLTDGAHEISRNMIVTDLLLFMTVPVAIGVLAHRGHIRKEEPRRQSEKSEGELSASVS